MAAWDAIGDALAPDGNLPWSVPSQGLGIFHSLPAWVGIYWKCRHKNWNDTWSPPRSIEEKTWVSE